ncbi:hypothetical protein ABVK25_004914 [Lepraria finkii]|uniref:Uncharacterized protein n=1 Tax=Lepraria finkii TaxID=1340010 RepID=A0ABR4B9S9_9LECA
MAKRKHPDSQQNDGLYNKRSRLNQADGSDDSPSSQAKIDPTYGQRGAFPGLDDDVEDGLFYGPASDGLEYLRMVRSEAKTVPNLLVAPSSPAFHSQRENLYEDYPQGYYADGAYTALPIPSSNGAHPKHDQEDDIDPQEAYYTSLCARFEELSSILQNPPFPPDANLIGQPLSWWNSSHWRNRILKTTPQMSKLAEFPQDMVIRGLEVLETVLNSGNLRSGKGRNVGGLGVGFAGEV